MGLNARTALDPRWQKHHASVPEGFMTAEIKIVRKLNTPKVNYNQTTGKYDTGSVEVIFEGKARIQPYGIIGDTLVAQDTTGRRLMRVQVPGLITGITLDDMLSVTRCDSNPDLTTYSMEIRGAIGSTQAWLTDLVVEANLKPAFTLAQFNIPVPFGTGVFGVGVYGDDDE
jgi:hypothetical protein